MPGLQTNPCLTLPPLSICHRKNEMNFWFLTSVCLLLCVASTTDSLASEESAPNKKPAELELKTERVFVFKDGHCLIVKKGMAKTNKEGVAYTEDVADAAVLGSFWAVPTEGTVESMTAGWVDEEEELTREETCTNVIEVIRANVGKECSFTLDEDRQMRGKIVKVLHPEYPSELPILSASDVGDPFSDARASLSIPRSTAPPFTGEGDLFAHQFAASYFLLSTDGGDVMVSANEVRNLTIRKMNVEIEKKYVRRSRRKRLSLQFAEKNADVEITMMYFRPDVRWIPTYRVDLASDDQPKRKSKSKAKGKQAADSPMATVSLQGELLNEAEDLIDVPFHLVVGVPNFRFKSVPSPLTLESTMQNLLARASVALGSNRDLNSQMSNAMFTQRSGEFRGGGSADSSVAVDMPGELTTQAGNDLFVYEIPAMTLKKGERATVPILTTSVPYRDVYTWELDHVHHDSVTAADPNSSQSSPLQLSENKVWRQIELTNATDMPWTTGAAMFMDGYQPVAQELLTYTSAGAKVRVPVTIAVDLRPDVNDRETDRELNAAKIRDRRYARLSGRLDVSLANRKKRPVVVEVRVRLGGKATAADAEGKISLQPYRNEDWHGNGHEVNNSSTVFWSKTIEPGKKLETGIDYEYLIRQ